MELKILSLDLLFFSSDILFEAFEDDELTEEEEAGPSLFNENPLFL